MHFNYHQIYHAELMTTMSVFVEQDGGFLHQ
jgi:hypothetical protein